MPEIFASVGKQQEKPDSHTVKNTYSIGVGATLKEPKFVTEARARRRDRKTVKRS